MSPPYFERDGIVIYHGDCRALLAWTAAAIVVTDPPYGICWRRGVNHKAHSRAHAGIAGDLDTSLRDEIIRLIPGKPAILFGSFYAPFPPELRQILVWQKPIDAGVVGSTIGYRRDVEPIFVVGPWPFRPVQWTSLLRTSAGSMAHTARATGHPHTKPIDLLIRLLSRTTGSIADPCMGTGTTLVAAQRLGRPAIGVDIDERCCEVAARRLQQGSLPLEAMLAG